jgi:YCII-related domain
MKRFLLLYSGPPPVNPAHEGWPEWFDRIGDALVEVGSPMKDGTVLHADGSTSDATNRLLGYGIVQAEDRAGVLELLRDHPLWLSGSEYTIEIFEVPRK